MRILRALLLMACLSCPALATTADIAPVTPSIPVIAPAPSIMPSPAPPASMATMRTMPTAVVTNGPSSSGSLLQVISGLLVVVGLLAATLWIMKRMTGARMGANTVIKVVGGVSVGNRERVLVLEVADQWLVIGVAPGRVSSLATLPRQDADEESAQTPSPNFAAWLKHTIEKRNGR